jgi:lipocalin
MGVDYNTESARVQARAQQVTHHVTTNYPKKDDLPFRCLEGEVETNFLHSPVQMPKFKGVKHSHQLFAIFLAFKVQSAEDYKEEFVNTSTAQYLWVHLKRMKTKKKSKMNLVEWRSNRGFILYYNYVVCCNLY